MIHFNGAEAGFDFFKAQAASVPGIIEEFLLRPTRHKAMPQCVAQAGNVMVRYRNEDAFHVRSYLAAEGKADQSFVYNCNFAS